MTFLLSIVYIITGLIIILSTIGGLIWMCVHPIISLWCFYIAAGLGFFVLILGIAYEIGEEIWGKRG